MRGSSRAIAQGGKYTCSPPATGQLCYCQLYAVKVHIVLIIDACLWGLKSSLQDMSKVSWCFGWARRTTLARWLSQMGLSACQVFMQCVAGKHGVNLYFYTVIAY